MPSEEKKFLDIDGLEYYDRNFYTKSESDELRNYNDYYDEITYVKERHYDTDCYFVTVPMTDSDGNEIELYIGDAGSGSGITPIKYARANHTTLTANATLNYGGSIGVGSVISNGEIIRDYNSSSYPYPDAKYVGIKANRVIVDYPFTTSAQTMLDDGCLQAWDVFYKMIDNGVILDMSNLNISAPDVATNKHPRQCLGQKADGTVIMLSCDGRTSLNAGLTSQETAQLLFDKGCINAWNLDGGGSTSTEIKESKLNRNIDEDGTKDRDIRYTLNAKKPTVNRAVAGAYSKISEEKQNIIQQIIPYINSEIAGVLSQKSDDIRGRDLDDLTDRIYIGYGNNLSSVPMFAGSSAPSSGYFVNIPHNWDEFIGKYAVQFYFTRDANEMFMRRQVNSTFTDWRRVYPDESTLVVFPGSDQTITAAHVYEIARARSVITSGNLITMNGYDSGTDTYTGFTFNTTSYHKISGTIQFKAATSGTKYIQMFRGDSSVNHSLTRFYGVADQEVAVPICTMFNVPNTTDVYTLRVYGEIGDIYTRGKLLID